MKQDLSLRYVLSMILLRLCLILGGVFTLYLPDTLASEKLFSAAIVEWDFAPEGKYKVNPLQAEVQNLPHLKDSFYPNKSPYHDSVGDNYRGHSELVYKTHVLGRTKFNPPFLINISRHLPEVIEALVDKGVRIFSFSIGFLDRTTWKEFEDAVIRHPEVLFIVATPHYPGKITTIRELDEYPSKLTLLPSVKNVLLAGCLSYNGMGAKERGSKENPYTIDNEQTEAAPIFYLRYCNMVGTYSGSPFGGTSAAAPTMATLSSLLLQKLPKKSQKASQLLTEMTKLMKKTYAVESTEGGPRLKQVRYFDFETVFQLNDLLVNN